MADDILQLAPADSSWFVVHARPRSEKKAAEFCRLQGGVFFLPLRKRVHRYGNRVRTFFSPLFTGYLFCMANRPARSMLEQNRHVANILEVVDQDQLVRQLQQIRLALQAGDEVDVLPYLQVGKIVRVTQGPLKGLEGRIARIKGKTRIVINVDMIRESVAVEVDSSYLDPA